MGDFYFLPNDCRYQSGQVGEKTEQKGKETASPQNIKRKLNSLFS